MDFLQILTPNFHTSSKPGKTQTLNFYLINKDFYFVDVPGYGYAAVSQDIENFPPNINPQVFSFLAVLVGSALIGDYDVNEQRKCVTIGVRHFLLVLFYII